MAMYTKMTATGSSLIVNPRTISKELESKIALSIAGVIQRQGAGGLQQLTTKLVRQAVEKEIHVSLTNHKEVLKRLMHQEFRKIKAQKVAKRVVPEPWKIQDRRESVRKAMQWIYLMLQGDKDAFNTLGMHAMQSLYDLQAVESGETLRLATLNVRLLGALWLKDEQRPQHWVPEATPTPEQVIQTLAEVYVIERLGICHDRRVELYEFFDRAPAVYSVTDYLGWNPGVGAPPADPTASSYERMSTALMLCYYAHAMSLSLGCSLAQVVQLLPSFYPWKSPTEAGSPSEYRAQVHLVVTIVMVLTNFGALRCEPDLLPHEYFFLRQHLVFHLARQDVSLISETLRALRCFDGSDNLVPVRRAQAFLLRSQQKDGCWSHLQQKELSTQVYTTTMNALLALHEPTTLGFAPSVPELAPILEMHLNSNISVKLPEAPPTPVKSTAKPAPRKLPTTTTNSSAPAAAPATATDNATAATAGALPQATDDGASHNGENMSDEALATKVRFLQSLLEKEGSIKEASATLATHVVSTLAALPLTVDLLKSTGVGRVVNKLRKHATPSVAKAATQLVTKWKQELL